MESNDMTTRLFSKRLWLHKDPELPENFNEIFRSRTEPFFDTVEKTAVLSEEAHFDGDIFTHISTTARPLLPQKLWDWIGYGEKVELEITVKARKKKLDEPITDMITKAIEENKNDGEVYIKTHDRLIFTLATQSQIHERQYVLHTPFSDGSGRKNVEYINSYGEIIHHPETEDPRDYYVIIGHVGDMITPFTIGRIWGNEKCSKTSLKEVLIKAYQHGLRFCNAPENDEIIFKIDQISDQIISLSCINDFYGFGESMRFCSNRDYQENTKLGTRGLDNHIINVIVTYRWFFNKPKLHATLKVTNDNQNKFTFDYKGLSDKINKKINEKYAKLEKKHPCFDPKFLRKKSLIIPYAEETCRT